jgi:hypothetical protein
LLTRPVTSCLRSQVSSNVRQHKHTVPRPDPEAPMPNTMPREITAFFENYRDAFNALNGSTVAEFYAEPSGIAQDGTYTYWPER